MKVKTSELIGVALDYAVALCEGGTDFRYDTIATYWITISDKDRALSTGWAQSFTPSTNWQQGGPIIEREKISADYDHDVWNASIHSMAFYVSGPTPLIAAMRCYVVSKLGNEIEIPEELVN